MPKLNKAYIGGDEVKKAYLGSSIVLDNASVIPLSSIISEWKFEDNLIDTVGGNNGVGTSISYVDLMVGKSVDFTTSASSSVRIPDSSSLSFGNGISDSEFSVSFLVNFNSVSGVNFVNKKRTDGKGIEYFASYQSGYVNFTLVDMTESFGNYIRVRALYTFNPLTDYHLTITYNANGFSSGLDIYVNGIKQTPLRESGGSYVAMHNNTGDLYFGKNANATNLSLNGYMDCVRFWSKELTQLEVTEIATKELIGVDINP